MTYDAHHFTTNVFSYGELTRMSLNISFRRCQLQRKHPANVEVMP